MTIGERIRQRRELLGMSQEELSHKLGYKSRSSVNKIELGLQQLGPSRIKDIATALDTTPYYIMGIFDKYDNIYPIDTVRIPFLGKVACGEPIFADEERESYVLAGSNIKADFCLQAKGDSMIGARIYDGDIVFVRKQDMVDDGEIAVVLIEDEATLKRVYYDREANVLSLYAENPQYKTMRFSGEQLNQIRILGRAVAFQSDVR